MNTGMPVTFADWVALLVQLAVVALAVGGFLWRVLRQPLVDMINGLGARVKPLEESCMSYGTLLNTHDRAIERLESVAVDGKEKMVELRGMVERLVLSMERTRTTNSEEDAEIRERLVRIETKVDAIQHREGGHH